MCVWWWRLQATELADEVKKMAQSLAETREERDVWKRRAAERQDSEAAASKEVAGLQTKLSHSDLEIQRLRRELDGQRGTQQMIQVCMRTVSRAVCGFTAALVACPG